MRITCKYCHKESSGHAFCPHCMRRSIAAKHYKNKKLPRLFARELIIYCPIPILCISFCLFIALLDQPSQMEQNELLPTETQTETDAAPTAYTTTEPTTATETTTNEPSTAPEPITNDIDAIIAGARRELDSWMTWSPAALSHFFDDLSIPHLQSHGAPLGEDDESIIQNLIQAAEENIRPIVNSDPTIQVYYYIYLFEENNEIRIDFSLQTSSSVPA